MALNGEKNGAIQAREKNLRSKKLYWVVGSSIIALVLFTLYYSFYVSSQQSYYNERAFRLLSSMGDKFGQNVEIAGNVLAASASFEDATKAGNYIHGILHGKVEEQDFAITGWNKKYPKARPTREGSLTLFLPDPPHTFRVRADYREERQAEAQQPAKRVGRTLVQATIPENPCSGDLPDLVVCATINFTPLVNTAFRDLEEGFFDDVLIAESQGDVLYQQSLEGTRIQNVVALTSAQNSSNLGSFFSKSGSPAPPSDGAASAPSHPSSFATLSQFSSERDVEMAGTDYQLFIQPLSVALRQKQQDRRLVLCGLRTLKHSHGQILAVPYTYLIWCVLFALTVFALGWPLLKLLYMSSKERLQARHILYLILSILLATASLTLIALNASYKLTSDESSKNELIQLADRINRNMKEEMSRALATLDALAADRALLKLAAGTEWNQASFLKAHQDMFQGGKALPYPYFRYFFLADDDGWQRLKFTVNLDATPITNVKNEPYFHPIMDGEFSQFTNGGAPYSFRMDPLYSPNTGEFLVGLAAPLPDLASAGLPAPKLRVKVLAIRFESVFRPVLPAGYGYAIVDSQGKVLFHSASVRNLNEDFSKESKGDVSVLALIEQGGRGFLDVSYLGTQKSMWITPVEGLRDPRLTLIVYKDSAYFTASNMAIVIVFSVLVMVYAILPFFVVVLIHVIRKGKYPLEAIWPNKDMKLHYFHIVLAHALLAGAFFCRYSTYGPVRAVLTVTAVAVVAAFYPFLECYSSSLGLTGNLLVLAVLVGESGFSFVLVFPLVFAALAFYPRLLILDNLFIRWVSLKQAYTLVVVSILVILVVVPSCGFFKVSYDYVQRLFLQTEQLDLARRLNDRQRTIEDYYGHLKTPKSFETSRLAETLDRYDSLFLNCPPQNVALPASQELDSNFVERAILDFTAQFPANAAIARLQELAHSQKNLPGLTWKFSKRVDNCAVTIPAHRSLWLSSADDPIPIISPYPAWPALDWRVRLCMTFAILALAVWIQFVPSRLFLLDMESLPTLAFWRPDQDGSTRYQPHHILLLGHPKSGKQLTVRRVPDVRRLDFAEIVTLGKWEIPEFDEKTVALYHFEFALDNADANLNKLRLLEEMVYIRHKHIILLSTVDPMYYLTAGSPDIVVPGKDKDLTVAIQILDRWAAILTPFRKLTIEDITVPGFRRVAEEMRKRRPDPAFLEFVDRVLMECDHTAQLRKIGAFILRSHRKDSGLSPVGLIQELLDRADSYYRVLWATCTQDERLVLYQLAKDGWANPKNELAIQHLQRRRLVTLMPGLRILNESFRQFIRTSQYHEEIATWEQEGQQSVWRSLKMSLGILAVAAAAWLLYSQQQFFNTVVAYLGAIGAAGGVVFKVFSEMRGGKSAPGGAST